MEPNSLNPAEAASPVSSEVGPYRIVRKLGEGGMAAVYLAEHRDDGRQVALKIPFALPGQVDDTVKRLQREAKAAASISHPNVCRMLEIGEHAGRVYLAMEFVDGCSLSEWLQKAPALTPDDAVAIVAKVARGLQAAHDVGILHRDLKTANVLVSQAGEPVLTDFGMARWTEAQHTVLTPTGAIVGTPAYMAPEQIMGETDRIGPATDVYGLGVILYELLTGWMPFSGNLATVLGAVVSKPPTAPTIHAPDLDPRLAAVCMKALAKAPEARYATAAEFAAAIEGYRSANLAGQTDRADAAISQGKESSSAGGGGRLGGLFRSIFSRG